MTLTAGNFTWQQVTSLDSRGLFVWLVSRKSVECQLSSSRIESHISIFETQVKLPLSTYRSTDTFCTMETLETQGADACVLP